jgi:hypothetical protein
MLSTAQRISGSDTPTSKILTVALRDVAANETAMRLARPALMRAWMPDAGSRQATLVAAAHSADIGNVDDFGLLQYGVLLASDPTLRFVANLIGSRLRLYESIMPAEVVHQAYRQFGERPAVKQAAASAAITMRNLGVIRMVDGQIVEPDRPLRPDRSLAGWFLHAVLLGRDVSELDRDVLAGRRGECFFVEWGWPEALTGLCRYPHLELHTQDRTQVAALRYVPAL